MPQSNAEGRFSASWSGPFMCFGSKRARADGVTAAIGAIPDPAMRVIDSAAVAHPPCLTRQHDGATRAVRTARKSLARSHESPAWTVGAVWIAAIRRRSDVAGAQQREKHRGKDDAMGFHARGGIGTEWDCKRCKTIHLIWIVRLLVERQAILLSFIAARFTVPAFKPRPT
jgi:hypothetical protein